MHFQDGPWLQLNSPCPLQSCARCPAGDMLLRINLAECLNVKPKTSYTSKFEPLTRLFTFWEISESWEVFRRQSAGFLSYLGKSLNLMIRCQDLKLWGEQFLYNVYDFLHCSRHKLGNMFHCDWFPWILINTSWNNPWGKCFYALPLWTPYRLIIMWQLSCLRTN